MDLQGKCALSFYEDLAPLKSGSDIRLMRHRESGQLFVKKRVSADNLPVYTELLEHPVKNMPRLALVVPDGEKLVVVEEYLPGSTLQELIEREGPLPEERALDYGVQLCRVVAQLHASQPSILHRDIKPANIIITGDGILKLLDLDAARLSHPGDRERSRDTHLLGTIGYAAPEQYGFQASSPQTDLYSIGVVLNVMLTGQLPGDRLTEGKLRGIISCCIRLDPTERYTSAEALCAALLALQRGKRPQIAVGWRRFLPPGFRGAELSVKIFAGMGYAFYLYIALTLEVEGAGIAALWLNRVTALCSILLVILFTGNYLDIWACLPLTRSKNLLIRAAGVLFYDVILFCAPIFVCTSICNALGLPY